MLGFNQVHLKLFMFWDYKNRDRGPWLRGCKNASMRWTYKCLWCISSPEAGKRNIQYARTTKHLGVTGWYFQRITGQNMLENWGLWQKFTITIVIYHHLDLMQVFGPSQLPRRPHPEAALSAKDQALSEKVRDFWELVVCPVRLTF